MLLICTVHICKIYVNNNFFRKRSLQIIWKTCKWKILLILIPCKKRNNTHSQSTQYKIWRKMHWFKVAMFFCYLQMVIFAKSFFVQTTCKICSIQIWKVNRNRKFQAFTFCVLQFCPIHILQVIYNAICIFCKQLV